MAKCYRPVFCLRDDHILQWHFRWLERASQKRYDQLEIGQGQLHHADFDPFDPFTVLDGHGVLENPDVGMVPILLLQGTIYPDGRMMGTMIKGIDADQTLLELPTHLLSESSASIPVIIGVRMAESTKLIKGDEVLLRWRDKNGTYDASNITVAGIFDNNVPIVDNGQIWMDIEKLHELTGLDGHATMFISSTPEAIKAEGWTFLTQGELLQDLEKMIASKKVGSSIMYGLLMAIALLAIFDTQVLSIFRRQKEIGTYIALGMTRWNVVGLFTVEGSMYSILATIVGSIYGIPIFIYMARTGMGMPAGTDDMGIAVAERIFPVYSVGLIVGTIILIVIAATIVSFLPARKIARMDPVEALKGKMQ